MGLVDFFKKTEKAVPSTQEQLPKKELERRATEPEQGKSILEDTEPKRLAERARDDIIMQGVRNEVPKLAELIYKVEKRIRSSNLEAISNIEEKYRELLKTLSLIKTKVGEHSFHLQRCKIDQRVSPDELQIAEEAMKWLEQTISDCESSAKFVKSFMQKREEQEIERLRNKISEISGGEKESEPMSIEEERDVLSENFQLAMNWAESVMEIERGIAERDSDIWANLEKRYHDAQRAMLDAEKALQNCYEIVTEWKRGPKVKPQELQREEKRLKTLKTAVLFSKDAVERIKQMMEKIDDSYRRQTGKGRWNPVFWKSKEK